MAMVTYQVMAPQKHIQKDIEELHTLISSMYQGRTQNIEYMSVNARVFNIVVNKKSGDMLYRELLELVENNITQLAHEISKACEESQYSNMLYVIMKYWEQFTRYNKTVRQVLIHLNEKHCRQKNIKTIDEIALEIFCSKTLGNDKIRSQINKNCIDVIRGDIVDKIPTSNTNNNTTNISYNNNMMSDMTDDTMNDTMNSTTLNTIPLSSSSRQYVNENERNLIISYITMLQTLFKCGIQQYFNDFITILVASTDEEFARHSALLFSNLDIIQYLRAVQNILQEEKERSRIYQLNYSSPHLEALVEHHYIKRFIEKILHNNQNHFATFVFLNDIPALQLYYKLLSRKPGFFDELIKEFSRIIRTAAKDCLDFDPATGKKSIGFESSASGTTMSTNSHPSPNVTPIQTIPAHIDRLVLFIMMIECQITEAFSNSSELSRILKQEISNIIIREHNIATYLGRYMNELVSLHPLVATSKLLNHPCHRPYHYYVFDSAITQTFSIPSTFQKMMEGGITSNNNYYTPTPIQVWEHRCRVIAGICSLDITCTDSLCELYRQQLSERVLLSPTLHTEASLAIEIALCSLMAKSPGFGKSFIETTDKIFNNAIVSSQLAEKYRLYQQHKFLQFQDTTLALESSDYTRNTILSLNAAIPLPTSPTLESQLSMKPQFWYSMKDVHFTPTITTTHIWVLKPTIDVIYPIDAQYLLTSYLDMFSHGNRNYKIGWNPNYGHAIMDVELHSGTRSVSMTTYQMIIFMLFQYQDTLTFEEIQTKTRIPRDEIIRHLLPFSHPAISLLTKQPNILETRDTDTFTFNPNATLPRLKNNPTQPFKLPLLNSNVSKLSHSQDVEKEKEKFSAGDIRVFLNAAIVRTVKRRQKCSYDDLLKDVTVAVGDRFEFDPAAFKISLDFVLDNDYLERDENDRSLFIFA